MSEAMIAARTRIASSPSRKTSTAESNAADDPVGTPSADGSESPWIVIKIPTANAAAPTSTATVTPTGVRTALTDLCLLV